jgi:hypothetical protein
MVYALAVSYWLMLPIAILAAGFLARNFIIFHDCGHASFLQSKRANNALGAIAGLLNLTPSMPRSRSFLQDDQTSHFFGQSQVTHPSSVGRAATSVRRVSLSQASINIATGLPCGQRSGARSIVGEVTRAAGLLRLIVAVATLCLVSHKLHLTWI